MVTDVRVLVADGQEVFRAGVRAALADTPDLAVVAETGDGHEAVALARSARCAVAVVGEPTTGLDATDLTRRLVAGAQPVAVLALGSGDDGHLQALLSAGARGYHRRELGVAVLRDAVRALASGRSRICSEVVTALMHRFAAAADAAAAPTADPPTLTPRERQVLAEVARGGSNREVAAFLGVSETTVKGNLHRALVKLGARSRTEAVRRAVLAGLVTLPTD